MSHNFDFPQLFHPRPPSNADMHGPQLLGYRVYIREMVCGQDSCVEKKTISEPGKRTARIGFLSKLSDL